MGVECRRCKLGRLEAIIAEHYATFDLDPRRFSPDDFRKLYPRSARPYGKLYAY